MNSNILFNGLTKEVVEKNYLAFDSTNIYELCASIYLVVVNLYLLIKILFTLRQTIEWHARDVEVDPSKLICINSILLLSVISIYKFLFSMF